MVMAWVKRLAIMFALMAGTHPGLAAQPSPPPSPPSIVPHTYITSTEHRARTNKPAAQAEQEDARADVHEAACNAGDSTACAALGEAFERGEGRAQNRPVAEILYREACDSGAAQACFRLGTLLRGATQPESPQVIAALLDKSCKMGSLDGCEAVAEWLGSSDAKAAETLRRAACTAGRSQSCVKLARDLVDRTRSAAEQDEGTALLDRVCRSGNADACRTAMSRWRGIENGDGARTREYQDLGCTAGDTYACTELGTAAMRGTWDGGTGTDPRARAIFYYDRACARGTYHCETAEGLRQEPLLDARCTAGTDAKACAALGLLLARQGRPFENLPRALVLLGPACDRASEPAEIEEVCETAGDLMMDQLAAGGDARRADAWLTRACDAGSDRACNTLAEALAEGKGLPADKPRALTLVAAQCDKGYPSECRFLEEQILEDPATPLTEAGSDFTPDMSEPETAARIAADSAAQDRDAEAFEASRCNETRVEFRGVIYVDRLCDNIGGVIGGFRLKPGDAPWQALVWRPARLGGMELTPDQRVLCGGAVVRTGWILTAAHCLVDEVEPTPGRKLRFPISTSGYRVRLGLANPLADEGISYPILKVIPHPSFKRAGFAFDIALIQYDPRGGQSAAVVRPVSRIRLDPQPMAQRTIFNRMPAYTFGWGTTAYEGESELPDVLRAARLELRDTDSCTRLTKVGGDRLGSVLCAAGARGEQACFGDSGGPLVTYSDADKVPTVIGVVSAGIKCGTTGVASRFTRLGHPAVQAWLASILPGFKSGQTAR